MTAGGPHEEFLGPYKKHVNVAWACEPIQIGSPLWRQDFKKGQAPCGVEI